MSAPTEALEVDGTIKGTGFQMTTGAVPGYVLKTDSNGNASWQFQSSGGGGGADDGIRKV